MSPDDQGKIPVWGDTCHSKLNFNTWEYKKEEINHVSSLSREGVWTTDVLYYDKVATALDDENNQAIFDFIIK